MVIEPRNNYDVEENINFGNLNTYEENFKKATTIVKRKNAIFEISKS